MKIPQLGDKIPSRGGPISKFFGRAILRLLGWKIDGEIPNFSKMVAIAAPHTSNWDFVIGMSALLAIGIDIHWIGKDAIFKWPFSIFWCWLGGKPVDRLHPHGVVHQTVEVFDAHEKFILGLSPEGTRKDMDHWRSGFYHMAKGANVPVFMIRFNFDRKTLELLDVFHLTDDMKADMHNMQMFFKDTFGVYVKTWQKNLTKEMTNV